MENEKAWRYLGLAAKAGRIASGEFQTENAIKKGAGKAVIIASDASENTKKKFLNMCSFYKVPVFVMSDKETLGHRIGREMRTSAAITDENLAAAFVKIMREEDPEN